MSETPETAREAIRILRRIETTFADNSKINGSGFLANRSGLVITCAHVVSKDRQGIREIRVGGNQGKLRALYADIDLAVIETAETETSSSGDSRSLELGRHLMFSGFPTGVAGASLFSGILSAQGDSLSTFPRCRLLQINGMINSGNSGGPVFLAGGTEVIGVITAKYVPLLREVDKLLEILRSMPQFPSEVAIGQIDFSKFVNLTMQAFLTISGSLRLVQIGTGFAVPIDLLPAL